MILYNGGSANLDFRQRRRLSVDAFYVAPLGQTVSVGDACPYPDSNFLPPDQNFPMTLYVLAGQTQDIVVYGCESDTVIGYVVFRYVGVDDTIPPVRM